MTQQQMPQKTSQQEKLAEQTRDVADKAGNQWQATFTKRLPHRIGQPLSSSGGGDGSAMPA